MAVVIVLHGISSSKSAQSGTIRNLAAQGIVGVALDLRAHGESGGEFATYGHHEKRDLSKVMDLVEQDYPGLPVGLWGSSYGGAIALQALAHDPRFDFGIVERTPICIRQMAQPIRGRSASFLIAPSPAPEPATGAAHRLDERTIAFASAESYG